MTVGLPVVELRGGQFDGETLLPRLTGDGPITSAVYFPERVVVRGPTGAATYLLSDEPRQIETGDRGKVTFEVVRVGTFEHSG